MNHRPILSAAAGAIFLVFSLSLFTYGQNNKPTSQSVDLSSPRKAFDSIARDLQAIDKMFKDRGKILDEIFLGLNPSKHPHLFSKKFIARYQALQKKNNNFTLNHSYPQKLIFDREEKRKDGQVVIHATQLVDIVTKKAQKTISTRQSKKFHKIAFAREGNQWRVSSWHETCRNCRGTGLCHICKGKGKTQTYKCFRCTKNPGNCPTCKGSKWFQIDHPKTVASHVLSLAVPKPKKITPFAQQDTPSNAVKTYHNLQDQIRTRTRTWLRKMTVHKIKFFQKYFSPKINDIIQGKMGAIEAEKNRRDKSRKRTVEAQKDKGTQTLVKVNESGLGYKNKPFSRTYYFQVKKINGKWQIVRKGRSCYLCKGKGSCFKCGGTGKVIPKKCFLCKGKGKRKTSRGEIKCYYCKGKGMTPAQACYRCKKLGGKCSVCKGRKISWK